jgi:protein-tyrosine-phosphatase
MRAVECLKARGVPVPGISRCPQQVSEADLVQADLIIALQESEHRATMEHLFPRWVHHVEYWHIEGQDDDGREPGLSLLENEVRALVARLQTRKEQPGPRTARLRASTVLT